MEFKLKNGWLDYFLSGVLAGVFVMALMIFQLRPDIVGFEQFLVGVFLLSVSIAFFVDGCRVKK